jgi:hypothetical protein
MWHSDKLNHDKLHKDSGVASVKGATENPGHK